MNVKFLLAVGAAGMLLAGCSTIPPGAERGPNGTMAFDVLIEASAPGAKIEANGEVVGTTPLHLKIFGDPDGTFHDFGAFTYNIRALPLTTNQFTQTRIFQTGHLLSGEDHIPQRIYFDMNQQAPTYTPGYSYPPAYGPPVYYEPAPYYYGPSFRFDIGPGYHRYHHYRRW
jgi:hypothetical protein